MNFQQLKIIREAARRDYNLTEVANALYTSQSGVSRHIRELEDELGIELFIRHGKRLLGMTEPGKELLVIAERMLNDANNIRKLADSFANREHGRLHVATTHTQARYALPRVVKEFRGLFPQVQLELHQGGPDEIVRLLQSGDTDVGISSERLDHAEGIVSFPYYHWHHTIVVPREHPLTRQGPLTLELSRLADQVVSVELDRSLLPILAETLADASLDQSIYEAGRPDETLAWRLGDPRFLNRRDEITGAAGDVGAANAQGAA